MLQQSKRHTTILALLSALATIILFPPIACGADQNTEITLSTSEEGWPPYIITTDEGPNNHGIMVDVMREITSTPDKTVVLAHFPEKRCQLLLKEGHVDAMPKAKEWVEDPSLFYWTDSVISSSDVLVSRRGECPPAKPEALTGKTIGVVLGYHYPTLAPLFKDGIIKRHDAHNTTNLMRMVKRGHIDIAVTNRHVAEWIIKNNDDMSAVEFSFSNRPIASAPYRFAFTKTWPCEKFIQLFNMELEAMKMDGRLQAIVKKYK